METTGALDDQTVVHGITEIMEGGREAFQYRQSIYQMHWTGGADDITESRMDEDSVATTKPPAAVLQCDGAADAGSDATPE